MKKYYQYYVEGQCEEKLINTLKDGVDRLVIPGKVSVFNVQCEYFTDTMLRTLKNKTVIILIFDTDIINKDIFEKNMQKLKSSGFNEIWCIPQDKNLEDELVKSTDIKKITDLLGTRSIKDHKSKFITEKCLKNKLTNHHFDIKEIWSSKASGKELGVENSSNKIKQ